MKPLLALFTLASAFALVTGHAEAATPAVVPYASLPTGVLAPPPPTKKAPGAIGAHERVPGIFVGAIPQHQTTVIAGTREHADRFSGRARASIRSDDDKSREICFSESNGGRGEQEAPAWAPNVQSFVTMMSRLGGDRVSPIHVERVVDERDGRATLEVTDAWVDGHSRGVRLIGSTKLPLKLVANAPGDIRVYAMRDKDRLHVVLVEPASTARTWQGIVQTGDQGMSTSGCRHARASLALARGTGETSTFVLTAELPGTHADKQLLSENSVGTNGMEAVRTRPLHVHASVSWATREPEPVLSVSMGWEARDRPTAVFRGDKANVAKK